jgi:RNA polymerase-binding transcription factor DksA
MTISEAELRRRLTERRAELDALLERIHRNIKRGFDRDSKERAKELEDRDVVDTLGNDALGERLMIDATLDRLDAGLWGTCVSCGEAIAPARLAAYPYASRCVDCASDLELEERQRA